MPRAEQLLRGAALLQDESETAPRRLFLSWAQRGTSWALRGGLNFVIYYLSPSIKIDKRRKGKKKRNQMKIKILRRKEARMNENITTAVESSCPLGDACCPIVSHGLNKRVPTSRDASTIQQGHVWKSTRRYVLFP